MPDEEDVKIYVPSGSSGKPVPENESDEVRIYPGVS